MTTQAETIPADVFEGFGDDADDIGANAFLASLTGEDPAKKRASTNDDEAEGTGPGETETSTETETTSEGETPTDEGDKTPDPDDQEIEIKVGEETKKATLKELKRLYGQEASLTQKSQKVAEAQRAADTQRERADVALKTMLEKAEEKFKPYKDLDWFVLSQRMDTADFQALRADFEVAQKDLVFLQTEVDTRLQETRNTALQARNAAAQETVKLLSDPKDGIPDFGPQVYREMMTYALGHGVSEAPNLVNSGALRLIHKAMLYDREQTTKKAAAAKVTKAVNQATRVMNPTTTSKPTTPASSGKREAMRSLQKTGSVDDAAAAFLASFQD